MAEFCTQSSQIESSRNLKIFPAHVLLRGEDLLDAKPENGAFVFQTLCFKKIRFLGKISDDVVDGNDSSKTVYTVVGEKNVTINVHLCNDILQFREDAPSPDDMVDFLGTLEVDKENGKKYMQATGFSVQNDENYAIYRKLNIQILYEKLYFKSLQKNKLNLKSKKLKIDEKRELIMTPSRPSSEKRLKGSVATLEISHTSPHERKRYINSPFYALPLPENRLKSQIPTPNISKLTSKRKKRKFGSSSLSPAEEKARKKLKLEEKLIKNISPDEREKIGVEIVEHLKTKKEGAPLDELKQLITKISETLLLDILLKLQNQYLIYKPNESNKYCIL